MRDEYDEQRKISREAQSLDIQRPGQDFTKSADKPPILTLRDQQEANDARTSWRPQEVWDDAPRRTSVEVTSGSGHRPLAPNKAGAWDLDQMCQPRPAICQLLMLPVVCARLLRLSTIKVSSQSSTLPQVE